MDFVYLCDCKKKLTFNQEYDLMSLLPDSYANNISSIKNSKKKHQKLISKILLIYALSNSNCHRSLLELKYTHEERPYFHDSKIDFNISYTNNYVSIATTTSGRIGIDIEYIKPIKYKKNLRQFTPSEWEFITTSTDSINAFYYLWTRKEALVKAHGKGITLLPKISGLNDKVYLEDKYYTIHTIPMPNDYILHIASQSKSKKTIRKINLNTHELYELAIKSI